VYGFFRNLPTLVQEPVAGIILESKEIDRENIEIEHEVHGEAHPETQRTLDNSVGYQYEVTRMLSL